MGLFDKKYCSICGNQIKLLGNRKLEDGNCCKDCASKLSPFFSERRHSTVESIKEQLSYREANKADVAGFKVTRTIGDGTKILADEDHQKFLITSAGKNWRDENPDVIPFSAVTGCETRVEESREEQKTTDKDGKSVSYRPPRYTYSYNFPVTVFVNHPYFDEIRFRLNRSSVREECVGTAVRHGAEYENFLQSQQDVKQLFQGIRQDAREAAAAASAPKVPVKCPSCGATTIPDEKGCCEYCGSAV